MRTTRDFEAVFLVRPFGGAVRLLSLNAHHRFAVDADL